MKPYSQILELLKNKDRENYVERTPEDLYTRVSERTGVDKNTIKKIGGVESEHGKYEDNFAGSSAKGVFQLMPNLIKNFKPEGMKSPKSFSTQEDVMTGYLKEMTKKIGVDAPEEDFYAYHNLGYPKFKRFKKAKDDQPMEQVLPLEIIRKNPKFYKDKTKKQAVEEIKNMLGERSSSKEQKK